MTSYFGDELIKVKVIAAPYEWLEILFNPNMGTFYTVETLAHYYKLELRHICQIYDEMVDSFIGFVEP